MSSAGPKAAGITKNKSELPKKIKKTKLNPIVLQDNEDTMKKMSTKDMIREALTESKSRKGISLYAIKKYMEDKFQADTKKIDYIIKKVLKNDIATGNIVQTKGIGASGSFKLAPGKTTKAKKNKESVATDKGVVKDKKNKPGISKEKVVGTDKKKMQTKTKNVKITKPEEKPKKIRSETEMKNLKISSKKPVPTKGEAVAKTPSKKRANLMKRKSIGSIIKPPKMKPKAVAR